PHLLRGSGLSHKGRGKNLAYLFNSNAVQYPKELKYRITTKEAIIMDLPTPPRKLTSSILFFLSLYPALAYSMAEIWPGITINGALQNDNVLYLNLNVDII
ncbi:MAG TPA: hypothetical protein VHZ76_07660, partial [Gammaproteobacteria bacterium]|nr:hypothetical protein [Gammaproteobacteria bacterium]